MTRQSLRSDTQCNSWQSVSGGATSAFRDAQYSRAPQKAPVSLPMHRNELINRRLPGKIQEFADAHTVQC